MKETSASASDPRKPSTARPYVPPTISPQDLPIDYAGFLAVVLGVTGVMFRSISGAEWLCPGERKVLQPFDEQIQDDKYHFTDFGSKYPPLPKNKTRSSTPVDVSRHSPDLCKVPQKT
ncbi:Protein Asterix [Ananas comosus]|uniref:Protein Asterix n=1 Tax=Ananas comosus TaxID=4615 RepID=A0A199VS89_ANACO|nr:Protein Asterix [Ananas comosus]